MRSLILLFLFIAPFKLASQEVETDTNSIFAFVHSSTLAGPRVSIPGGSEKFAHAQRIYEQLVNARGDFRNPVPDFVMTRSRNNVAWMNYQANQIGLEEAAYDVCISMGDEADAALAFLLGHELSHFYEKHSWRREFVSKFSDLKIGEKLQGVNDSVLNETQADYLGGFLAYSAGFPVFKKGGDLTRALYKAYGLPDQLPIYPHLDERVELSHRSAEQLDKLVDIYEMAKLLTIVGQYEEAAYYYQHVLKEYQSREVYNNAGVMSMLAAQTYLVSSDSSYILPIQLDMSQINSRGKQDEATQLLHAAIRHFDAAISLDPDYAPAYLNKACAYVLLKDFNRARFYAEIEAVQASSRNETFKQTQQDAQMVLGIIAAETKDQALAEAIFLQAMEHDSVLAQHNLRVLHREPHPEQTDNEGISLRPEMIDSINLILQASQLPVDFKNRIKVGPGLYFYQNPEVGPSSRLLVSQNMAQDGMPKRFFLATKPGYTGKSAKRVSVGDPESQVIRRYKTPTRIYKTTNGKLLLYKSVVFILEKQPNETEEQVVGWVLWTE